MLIRRYQEHEVAYVPGLSQENRPLEDRPYGPDWVVTKLSHDVEDKSFWVTGTNLNNDEEFFWNLRADRPMSWRYDFTNTKYFQGEHHE